MNYEYAVDPEKFTYCDRCDGQLSMYYVGHNTIDCPFDKKITWESKAEIKSAVDTCDVCSQSSVPVLIVDTSGGEYYKIKMCKNCINDFFN